MATLAERAAAAQARLQPKAESREDRSTPSAPVKLSKALQAEADYDGPIERVELDGLAVLKILQHASGQLNSAALGASSSSASLTNNASNAAGFLFGLSLGDRLSISNAFAVPQGSLLPSHITTLANVSQNSATTADERSKAAKVASSRESEVDGAFSNAQKFISAYLPRAKELNLDNEVVGGYFITRDGADLLKEGILVDVLVRLQFGAGSSSASSAPSGVGGSAASRAAAAPAKIRPTGRGNRRAVAVVYDAASSTASSLAIKAYTLSPNFMQLQESTPSYSQHRFDYASLAAAGLQPSTLVSSFPISITSSSLLTAFLSANPEVQSMSAQQHSSSFGALCNDDTLENNLRSLLSAVDSANASIQSLGYQGRNRYGGGAQSNSDTLNRLESIRTMAVADGVAKSLGQEAGLGTVRAWASRSAV